MNYIEQAKKELARAKKALQAAKTLLENQLYEDCVSSHIMLYCTLQKPR